MSEYNLTLDYRELLDKIKRHCQAGDTGTAFIKSDSHNLARFVIRDGVIVSCVYRNKTGFGAIPELRKIASGSFRFSQHSVEGMKFPAMPDTGEFFELLERAVSDDPAPAPAPVKPSATPKTSVSIGDDPALIAIKMVLKDYIGPMADIVCNHYLQSRSELLQSKRYKELINQLAENIGNESERSEFVKNALKRIGLA